ncbi:hypothetical protein CBA19CS91_01750 [Paraburkholderia hospita]|nr:hypothetical protein CBA19CS91_01750 [Paraburkholderia hospita]
MNDDLGMNGYLGFNQGQALGLGMGQIGGVTNQQLQQMAAMQNAAYSRPTNPDERLLVLLTED